MADVIEVTVHKIRAELFFGEWSEKLIPQLGVAAACHLQPVLLYRIWNRQFASSNRGDQNLCDYPLSRGARHPLRPFAAHAVGNHDELIRTGIVRDSEHVAGEAVGGEPAGGLLGSAVPTQIDNQGAQTGQLEVLEQLCP